MKLRTFLMNPSGNRTLLALLPDGEKPSPELSARLMAREPLAEQLGYVGCRAEDQPTLQMAGGEFCGNASMSAAALICRSEGLEEGTGAYVELQVSGADTPVPVLVSLRGGTYFCTVEMPRPAAMEEVTLALDSGSVTLPAVRFPGITHLLAVGRPDRALAESVIRGWCAALDCAALGIMFWEEEENRLTPLVYVPGAGTLFWESSCASGTAALGAWLAAKRKETVRLKLSEPGGTLAVLAVPSGSLRLSGTVIPEKAEEVTLEV